MYVNLPSLIVYYVSAVKREKKAPQYISATWVKH